MAIFIDPPRWPAHGTVFSHLISDISLRELHDFAQSLGISPRAFDRDHYDIPEEMYATAIRAGAKPVDGAELIQILRGSGLRVPARERPEKILSLLRSKWAKISPEEPALGEELLERWSEPHRRYHTSVHLLECLDGIELLAPRELAVTPPREALLAAWFHDAVYDGVAGDDEARSAELAEEALGGALGQEVARLVLLTRDHVVDPDDSTGKLLVDADLSILAADCARYFRYVQEVRQEYTHATDEQWSKGRLAVLTNFLARPHIFSSSSANCMWQEKAKKNLTWEIQGLRSP